MIKRQRKGHSDDSPVAEANPTYMTTISADLLMNSLEVKLGNFVTFENLFANLTLFTIRVAVGRGGSR